MKKNILVFMIPFIILISLFVIGCTKNKNKSDNTEDIFTFTYKDVDVTPGKEFNSELINEEAEYLELDSCAFEGNDKVYKYEGIEIIVSPIKGKDTIYSIYFLNDTVQTSEGVKIADEKTIMIEKYGDDYQFINNKYTYAKSNVELSFIIENDVIISIEYTYDTNNT